MMWAVNVPLRMDSEIIEVAVKYNICRECVVRTIIAGMEDQLEQEYRRSVRRLGKRKEQG